MLSAQQAFNVISKKIPNFPEDVAILGSGWNKAIDAKKVEIELSYSELFGVDTSVPGHEGKLVVTTIGTQRVAAMIGRFHRYEEFSSHEVTLPIRVFAQAGAKRIVITAACGALNEKYLVGDFVITSDLITLFLPDSPLKGPQFLDVSEVFDPQLRQKMRQTAVELEIPFEQGVYCYYHGPNYETPADKMALRFLGADVVGMSTVPETLMARQLGLKVVSLAFVTNLAFVKHNHVEVLAAANEASSKMVKLLDRYYTN
jgi:purine-nucleoside phosphorylase